MLKETFFQVNFLLWALIAEAHYMSLLCPADKKEKWSYRGSNGPRKWGKKYPACDGVKQSPIAIYHLFAEGDPTLDKLEFNNYDKPVSKACIKNNGHTIQLSPTDDVKRTVYVAGETYALKQLHFHWGKLSWYGSEHALDGRRYAMEMHLVHRSPDNKTAVVGILFKETSETNKALRPFVDILSHVQYKDQKTKLESDFNLKELLPENKDSYYSYSGSLTTPPCTEGVNWSILTEPIRVGKTQMERFRTIYSARESEAKRGCKMAPNYRPAQRLHGRRVFVSQW